MLIWMDLSHLNPNGPVPLCRDFHPPAASPSASLRVPHAGRQPSSASIDFSTFWMGLRSATRNGSDRGDLSGNYLPEKTQLDLSLKISTSTVSIVFAAPTKKRFYFSQSVSLSRTGVAKLVDRRGQNVFLSLTQRTKQQQTNRAFCWPNLWKNISTSIATKYNKICLFQVPLYLALYWNYS